MVKGFIFDLDGTIYLDNQIIDGAVEAIDYLRKEGHKVVFFTNKSISTREEYVKKLNKLGISTILDEVINSNYITANYLKQNMISTDSVYVIGEAALFEELKRENIRMTEDPKLATYVVFGWDRQFTYEKLNNAYKAWARNKAIILATNPDRTCPTADGQVPDCAAMIGAFEGSTGRPIDYIMGKPSKLAADFVVNEVLQLQPEQCFIVGDRLETDIRMGYENKLQTVLVLTGITTIDMVKDSSSKPDFILESIKDITAIKEIAEAL
ncbi:arabinose operon protein AraL [Bacillus sp. OV322]|uniref:HAD-IIA family hydrolase n=1 Tax=Bacillus sp. OV322 TaxID=1882764 RepID=UPI0008E31ECF|nr:HAD-IIA family hydrolase [Bacillus sp. OV322]SFC90957.1 arabinose operon protein AraL [Bacillus sp. OV322]